MKKLILFSLLALHSLAFAQNKKANGSIEGVVLDSLKKTYCGQGIISVYQENNVKVKSVTPIDTNGHFVIDDLLYKTYRLVFTYSGYEEKQLNITINQNLALRKNVGEILLSPKLHQLAEVIVTSRKQIIKQEVDRISYNVQADPESKTKSLLEILHKVPLITVDATGTIKLKASGNYKILIDGRSSSLVAKNPSDVFRAMPASNIEKIEVITIPPAKYDSEGLAGILNIITKKKLVQGYNGSINSSYNTVYGTSSSILMNLKKNKLGVIFYAGLGWQNTRELGYESAQTQTSPTYSVLNQNGQTTNSNNYRLGNLEISYQPDTLNLITGSGGYNRYYSTQGIELTNVLFNANNELTQSFDINSTGNSLFNTADVSFNYQKGFKRNKKQYLTFSYQYSFISNKQENGVATSKQFNYNNNDYNQKNDAESNEHTLQVDYIQPKKTITIEAGGKMILRSNTSNFLTSIVTNDDGNDGGNNFLNLIKMFIAYIIPIN